MIILQYCCIWNGSDLLPVELFPYSSVVMWLYYKRSLRLPHPPAVELLLHTENTKLSIVDSFQMTLHIICF